MIDTHGHYARQKFYVIQPVIRVNLDLLSYNMTDLRNKNAYNSPLDAKNIVTDAEIVQKSS